jgi:hypothetical protein
MNDVFYAPVLLLPLLAGGGWEGVKLLMEGQERPHPSPPLRAGEGALLLRSSLAPPTGTGQGTGLLAGLKPMVGCRKQEFGQTRKISGPNGLVAYRNSNS